MVRWAVRWYFSRALLFILWGACVDGNHPLMIKHSTHSIMHIVFRFCVDLEFWNMKFFPQPILVCLKTALISSFKRSFNFTSLLVFSYNNLNVISIFKDVLSFVCHFTIGDLDLLGNFSEHVPFHSYWIIISSFPVIQIFLHITLTSLATCTVVVSIFVPLSSTISVCCESGFMLS